MHYDAFPLSSSQRNIWNLSQAYPGTPINNVCSIIGVSGNYNPICLQQAVLALYKACPSLSTRITIKNEQPVQYESGIRPAQIPFLDFSTTNAEGIAAWESAVAREPMPIPDSPLVQFYVFKNSLNSGGVLVKMHHIISDAWSQMLIGNYIMRNYVNLLRGDAVEDAAFPSFREHVEDESAYLSSKRHEKDVSFWKQKLDSLPANDAQESFNLQVSPVSRRKSIRLTSRLSRKIDAFCNENRVSPFTVFYMALAVYEQRIKGRSSFTIGVPSINRITFTAKQTIGMFVNTLPFAGNISADDSFLSLCARVKNEWFELLRHQQIPFDSIKALAGDNAATLFDAALSYQNGRMEDLHESDIHFSGRWLPSGYQAEALCIHVSHMQQHMQVDYDYRTQLFGDEEIDALHRYLTNILGCALTDPALPLSQLTILDEDEEESLLFGFNQNEQWFPHEKNIHAQLKRIVDENPARTAVIFGGKRYSYTELFDDALIIAGGIAEKLPKGERVVAIALPCSYDLFAAMCAVTISGNTWLFIDPTQPMARIRGLLGQSGASLLISDDLSMDSGIKTLSLRMLRESLFGGELPESGLDSLAYLVCTSGSTGAPKAVEIMQKSVLNLAFAVKSLYPKGAVLSLCNTVFDAFVLESICALLCARTIVIPAASHRNDPGKLAEYIAGYDVGLIALTPSRLQAYLQNEDFRYTLGSIQSIICGGEQLSSQLLAAIRPHTSATLYNQYGPSEATVAVTCAAATGADHITIGKPLANCRIYILDEDLQPLPIGARGELFVGGICLARGYMGDDALTESCFISDPFRAGERMYKTGDMGAWTSEGTIIFLGRKDHQMKLRGHRIEPAEIEACLSSHPQVNTAAVKVSDGRLLAYYTASDEISSNTLLSFAAGLLPDYMVPVHAQRIDAIPMNANGKTDYDALPDVVLSQDNSAPADEMEQKLLEMWKQALDTREIGTNTGFFVAGGDSLKALSLLAAISDEFGVDVDIITLQTHSAVSNMAGLLRESLGIAPSAVPRAVEQFPTAPDSDTYAPSPAQRSFYVLSLLDKTGTGYNMPGAFRPSIPLEADRLEKAFTRLIKQDEMLRTGFEQEHMKIVARVHPEVSFALENLGSSDAESVLASFARPFDLAKPPLIRAGVMYDKTGRQFLLMDMHHIISDGISSDILFKRLNAIYSGDAPTMPKLRYRDYAYWLEQQAQSDSLCRQQEYWKSHFANGIPELTLPTDNPRAGAFDGKGARYNFRLSETATAACREYCRRKQITPFSLLLSLFGLVLARYARAEKLIVGSPVSGRRLSALQQITGAFVNTLPLMLDAQSGMSFEEYAGGAHREVMSALDNQDIPLEEILRLADVARSSEGNELYNILFSMVPFDSSGLALAESKLEPVVIGDGSVKMELHLEVTDRSDCFAFCFEYATGLYNQPTMEIYAGGLIAALEFVMQSGNDQTPLRSVPVVSTGDYLRLYERPWRMRTPYDAAPVDSIIDSFASITPSAAAIRWGEGQSLTFREVKERSDSLAARLVARGVGVKDCVAFMPKRDGDMIPTMLAILKAGAAYIPVDPTFPPDRIAYMLETAQAKLLLHSPEITPPELMTCSSMALDFTRSETEDLPSGRSLGDPFNVLFTSGSTGRPKGVKMVHKSISNLLAHVDPLLGGEDSRMLCASNCVFDVFTTEALLTLATGRCAVVASEEEMLLPWKLAERIVVDKADVIQLTPSRLLMCLASEDFCNSLRGVKSIILLGEPWTLALRDRLRKLTNARIFNIYGPTETSVHNCQGDVTEASCIHIGLPIGNCRYYILDENQNLLPPTAMGEIYIAGECLALGYAGRDDLTAQVYLPDPFFPGSLMYKTGDIGRMRADGTWQCLGRVDTQLKLHGHRIEPAEIAAQIVESGYAAEAAVIPVMKDGIPQSLQAFVVPAQNYDRDVLLDHLRAKLPDYMVPSAIVKLGALPRNANGKTDLKALAAVEADEDLQAESAANQSGKLAGFDQRLVALWQDALCKTPDPETSFFLQGGTSLSAIMILNRCHQEGISLSLSDFYKNPTLREQTILLHGSVQSDDAAKQSPQLLRHMPENNRTVDLSGHVLLTGATGFLGAHLLRRLIEADCRQVICLVRGDAETRLKETLAYYFGENFYADNQSKILPVSGDITSPDCGLSSIKYRGLCQYADVVLHSAADVRHFAPQNELDLSNIEGTRNMLAFAKEADAPFIHISTVSVAGEYLKHDPKTEATFCENDLDIGQNWEENPYVRSKTHSEILVAKAIADGRNARIYRVGRLVSRADDGLFQHNMGSNAFYREMCALLYMGCAPRGYVSMPVELTSVDLCADAIVRLASRPGSVFHIFNHNMTTLSALLEACGDILFLPETAFSAFMKAAIENKDAPDYVHSLAESYFYGNFERNRITVDSQATQNALAETGFFWQMPALAEIIKCLRAKRDGVSS